MITDETEGKHLELLEELAEFMEEVKDRVQGGTLSETNQAIRDDKDSPWKVCVEFQLVQKEMPFDMELQNLVADFEIKLADDSRFDYIYFEMHVVPV